MYHVYFFFVYKFGRKRKEKAFWYKMSIKWEIIALAVVQWRRRNFQQSLSIKRSEKKKPQKTNKKQVKNRNVTHILFHCLCNVRSNLYLVARHLYVFIFSLIADTDQVGQHPSRRYRRQQPEADPGFNMDHHSPLPGTLVISLFFFSLQFHLETKEEEEELLLFPVSRGITSKPDRWLFFFVALFSYFFGDDSRIKKKNVSAYRLASCDKDLKIEDENGSWHFLCTTV